LASSAVFIEPSPHDALMGVLLVMAIVAGVRLDRVMLAPFLLLLVWNVGGMIALMHVPGREKTVQYTGTSVYLAVAAMLFAALFAHNTMARLNTMRVAYIITAVIASFLGMAGYFDIAGLAHLFAPGGRALGAFKDPNVYGPFLIWPTLFLIDRMMRRHISVTDVIVVGIIVFGLFLSFSRGAWFHFAVSALVMVGLDFVTAPTPRGRLRVLLLSLAAVLALIVLLMIALQFQVISQMFAERAHLLQSYDVGQGGRFRLQELALTAVLRFPFGMGPFEFARVHGTQQHNVYLQALLVYGWLGAMAYIVLLLSTVFVGPTATIGAISICCSGSSGVWRRRPSEPRARRKRHGARRRPPGWPATRVRPAPQTYYFLQSSIGWCWTPPGMCTISQSLKPAARATLNRYSVR
ncbi:MAG: O-antigen ligase family protein, partial [Pseudolabrys sp.]